MNRLSRVGEEEKGREGEHSFPSSPHPPVFHSRQAFTMIELLVVLAIIVVITTISIPTIDAMASPKHALRKEGRRIMQLMTEARTAAMSRKVQVDLRIDPATREIRMVEARAFRSLQLDDPYALASAADTNRYEKAVAFDEEYSLESFSVAQIKTGEEDEDPVFQTLDVPRLGTSEEEGDQLAVSFSHFGGSSGGGISLLLEGVRLDIAADILTGRPKIVKRSAEE